MKLFLEICLVNLNVMKGLILLVLIGMFSACGIIRINENGYRDLKEYEKTLIIPIVEQNAR